MKMDAGLSAVLRAERLEATVEKMAEALREAKRYIRSGVDGSVPELWIETMIDAALDGR